MDDRSKNLILAIAGLALCIVSVISLGAVVYGEVMRDKTISTQLATLLAIPLAASVAMMKSAFSTSGKPEDKEGGT